MHEGEVISEKYILERKLGAGGMGEVWLARHQFLNQQVALKFLFSHLLSGSARDEIKRKFLQEAQIGALLDHPNIVRVRDFEPYKDSFYILMDYVQGTDLRKIIGSHPLPEEQMISYIMQILSALHAAHKHHFVHRDIKPSNIFIDTQGKAYLADFGIAKALDTITHSTTRPSYTPEYAAPEQFSPKHFGNVSYVTDIYSLGITMYHMATGYPPFSGDPYELMYKHTQETPIPPRDINPRLSMEICNVILRAVEKRQENRFPNAVEMAKAIKKIPQIIDVPNWVGKPLAEVEREAKSLGIRIGTQTEEYSNQIIAGLVINQNPAFGSKINPSESVDLVFSKGRELVVITVPNWLNKTLIEVEREARSLSITIGTKTKEYNNQIAEGAVVSQNPMPGSKIPSSETVDLVLSKGRETAPVFPPESVQPTPRFKEPVPPPKPPNKKGLLITLISLCVVALVVAGYFIITAGPGKDGKKPPPPPPPIPPEVIVAVPSVIGMDVTKAEESFKRVGFSVNIKDRPSVGDKTKITEQNPTTGQLNPAKGEWVITCTKPAWVEKVEDGYRTVIDSSGPFGDVSHKEKKYKDVPREAEYKAEWVSTGG